MPTQDSEEDGGDDMVVLAPRSNATQLLPKTFAAAPRAAKVIPARKSTRKVIESVNATQANMLSNKQ